MRCSALRRRSVRMHMRDCDRVREFKKIVQNNHENTEQNDIKIERFTTEKKNQKTSKKQLQIFKMICKISAIPRIRVTLPLP